LSRAEPTLREPMQSESRSAHARTKLWLGALALCVLVWIAFGPALTGDWILFDDPAYVTKNAAVAGGLTAEGVRYAFTAIHGGNWHPLTTLSHQLDVELFGLAPLGPHAVNLALHALAAVLAFGVLASLTGALGPSWITAALFAIHPLRVESVAWISERKDVLSAVFFWLTLAAYARWCARPSPRRYALTAVALVLGLMAKPMLVTLPCVLVLVDVWPLKRFDWQAPLGAALWARVREKLPLFALAAAASVVTYVVQHASGAMTSVERFPLALRLANAPIAVVEYLRMSFWPVGLAPFYPHVERNSFALPIVAALVLALVTLASWRQARRRPWLCVGWLWFLGMLVPVIGIVQVGGQALADRYSYLPSAGLALALVFGLHAVLTAKSARIGAIGVTAAVLAASTLATRAQTHLWHDTRTLFAHALAVTRDNGIAHEVYGNSLFSSGEIDEAIEHLEAAVRISPGLPAAHNNLGSALGLKGRHAEALAHFERAIATQPSADAYHNWGFALAELKRFDEAIVKYEQAVALSPRHHGALFKLGVALGSLGRLDEAQRRLEQAVAVLPTDVETLRRLAITRILSSDVEDGIRYYERILALHPNDLDALNNVAWIRATHSEAQHRDGALAVRYAERARDQSATPDATLTSTLAAAYAEAGRFEEAIRSAELAIQLAHASGASAAEAAFEEQLAGYRAGRAFHH
jgi:protein O-mannosyl-transferase